MCQRKFPKATARIDTHVGIAHPGHVLLGNYLDFTAIWGTHFYPPSNILSSLNISGLYESPVADLLLLWYK